MLGYEGELVEVENITEPPFKFLYIDGDETCLPEVQKKMVKKMPAIYSETTIYGREHDTVVGDNDEEFYSIILESLEHHSEPLTYKNCKKLKDYYKKAN